MSSVVSSANCVNDIENPTSSAPECPPSPPPSSQTSCAGISTDQQHSVEQARTTTITASSTEAACIESKEKSFTNESFAKSLLLARDGPPLPVQYIATKTPKDTLKAVYKAGIYKAGLTLNLLCVQSFMAGIYIAMAGQLFLSVGGGVLGAALFPTGLIAVVFTSAELFTGDALVFVASVMGRQVSYKKLLRNWTVSWIMNFVGAVLWAFVMAYGSDALEDIGQKDYAIKVALKKAMKPWFHIFLKGIGANFMVCLAVWTATCAEEVAGKILALWFPVAGFVIMGFDHVIANQFLIPLGMMFGADISVYHLFINALLPATLGNIVGGGVFMGFVYWYVFDSMTSSIQLFSRIRDSFNRSIVVQQRNNNNGTTTPDGNNNTRGLRRRRQQQRATNNSNNDNNTDSDDNDNGTNEHVFSSDNIDVEVGRTR